MTIQTRLVSTFLTVIIVLGLTIPTTAVADSKTMPGTACDPTSQANDFAKVSSGGFVFTNSPLGFFVCNVVRDNTTNAPILKLQVKVNRADFNPELECVFRSLRPNGNLVQTQTRTTTKAGFQNLTVRNLRTVALGTVNVNCALRNGDALHWVFWQE